MAINRAQISRLMDTGLNVVFGQLPMYPEQWTEIYKTYSSKKAQEYDMEMKYLGPADVVAEGAPIGVDTMGQRYQTVYPMLKVALAFNITKEAIEDNQYQNDFPMRAVSLRNSLRVSKDILGANPLNNAFDPTYPIGDGQPLCSTSHPIDGGTLSNTFGDADGGPMFSAAFSEESVELAIIKVQQFAMQSGILSQTMPTKFILPRDLQFTATRLLESTYRVQSGNNDINAIYHLNYIPGGYRVNQYLVSQTAWFLLTDAEEGFKHFKRSGVETDVYVDPITYNVRCTALERYCFGVSNPRAVFGSQGV